MADSVKIRIDGDDSGYKKALDNIGRMTKASMADVKAGIDLATAALQKLSSVAGKGIDYNATLESLKTSFEVMTGSADKAVEVVERLRVMGAETPFEMTDLAGTVQMLMQYGFAADEAIDRMSMLGDVAQGNKDAMTSIAMGYAQMSSAGKVNLQDIKQMINGGFNPLQEISERTGESMASLYDRISKGKMSVDEITDSMRYATSEGGRFFQSMEKQSQTLSGQLSTLKDNADQLLGSLTEGLSEELRSEILPIANNMIGELQGAFAEGGVQGLVDSATAMIPDLLNMMSGEVQGAISGLSKWLPKGATALMKAIPGAIRGASAVLPEVTTALFEVSSVIIQDLVSMLPELVPDVISGIGKMAGSVLKGAEGMLTGLFTGIEQMFHQGQSKIAGIWVDDSELAKFDFKIDISTDSDAAQEKIAGAYDDVREALNTDLLTKDQRDEILDMIGEDYQTIYDKLISFGVPPEDAEVLAANITASSDAVLKYLDDLNLEVDNRTLLKWMVQANDSRIALREILRSEGLSDSDIEDVLSTFDKMNGRITEGTPNIAEQIYAELTDGLTDDPDALKKKVKAYIDAQDKAIDEAYNAAVAKLDPADGDYAEKLAALNEEYSAAKADLQTIGTDLDTLVDTLANASTATVQSKYQLLADVETQVNGLSKRIDELAGEAMTLGQQAYNVVRSGARTDEATISQAINFKVSEFRLDIQSTEDAYNETIADLNEKFNSGEIGKEDYNAGIESAQAQLEAQKKAAQQAYESALSEIFSGIAESEGVVNEIAANADKINLMRAMNQYIVEGMGAGLDESTKAEVESNLLQQIGEILGEDTAKQVASYLTAGNVRGFSEVLETWAGVLDIQAQEALENMDDSKIATTYKAALESGVLEGTDFDTKDSEGQLETLFTSIADNAVAKAKPIIEETGQEVAEEIAVGVLEGNDEVAAAGDNTVDTLDTTLAKAVHAARARGEEAGIAFAGGYKRTMMIKSPSRVMQQLGSYTGEGLDIGLRDSMKRAVATAKQLSGQIVTAADLSSSMQVNMPNLSQEIAIANEQNKTPVYLNGVQIAEIQGHNNSMQLAWQNTRAAKGVGSR